MAVGRVACIAFWDLGVSWRRCFGVDEKRGFKIIIHDDGSKVEIAGEYPFFRRPGFIAFGIMYEHFAIVWRLP